jgi:hypothetical protein
MSFNIVKFTNIDDQIEDGGLPWTPSDIITSAWYDASDLSTITETDIDNKISQWDDKSGNDHHVIQEVSSDQPKIGTRKFGRLNTIEFDGDDSLGTNDLVVSGNPDLMIATVRLSDAIASSANDIFVTLGDGGGSSAGLTVESDLGYNGLSWRFFNGFTAFGNANFGVPEIQIGVREAGSNYGASQMFLDGTSLSPTNNANPSNTPNIGAKLRMSSYGGFLDGQLAEVVILEDSTEDTRQKLEGYFAWKWGLVDSLPPAHPYKNVYPTIEYNV